MPAMSWSSTSSAASTLLSRAAAAVSWADLAASASAWTASQARLGLERDQIHRGGEAGPFQPGGQVGDEDVRGGQLRPDHLGPVRRGGRFGVRGLFLLAGHPLAAELAQLRVVERAADRAGCAVDQGGRELGAHAVDTRLAQP